MTRYWIGVFVILVAIGNSHGLDNGLARTPPMGWLSWERYRCNIDCVNDPDNCISENLYMRMADLLVSEGYAKAGYQYVNIDDCWMEKSRDTNGTLVADRHRFPHGIKWLADYVHAKGLKLGIYEDFGTFTCGGYPGSKFYLERDANTFASWGVDMVKLDGCYSNVQDMDFGYPAMALFLNRTGRPMLYSCSWPAYVVEGGHVPEYKKIAQNCNIWRNYKDVQDSWDSVYGIIEFYGNDIGNFSQIAGPGNFNDPDMLIIGDFGLSYDEQRAQMALWAIMSAPLMISADLRNMRPEAKALLQNDYLIRINQDGKGNMGRRIAKKVTFTKASKGVNMREWFNQGISETVYKSTYANGVDPDQMVREGNLEVWTKNMGFDDKTMAFAFMNIGEGGEPLRVSMPLYKLNLMEAQGYNVTEGFTGKFIGVLKPNDVINANVDPSGVWLGIAYFD